MKKINQIVIFVLLGLTYAPNTWGQFDEPLSLIAVDEKIFNRNDLSLKGVRKIICNVIHIDLIKPSRIDTIYNYTFLFNDTYNPTHIIHSDLIENIIDSSLFFYLENGNETIKEYKRYIQRNENGFDHKFVEFAGYYHYKKNKLVSSKENEIILKSKQLEIEKYDTFMYDKDRIIKVVSYWKDSSNQLSDSIVKSYVYDSLNNLIEYYISPSVTFNRRFPPNIYNTYSLRAKYQYQYFFDTKILKKYLYYDYLPKDSFSLSTDIVAKIKIDNNLVVYKNTTMHLNDYHIIFNDERLHTLLEFKYGETKSIRYIEETHLPQIMHIAGGNRLLLYYFEYSNEP